MSFVEKVSVVSGGTSGIGAETALLLARRGSRVVVCGRSAERGEAFLAQAQAEGLEIDFVAADCSVEEDVERLFAVVVERHGGVDKVFANAGFEHAESHADTTKQIWDHLIANDLTSSYMTCRYAIAPLRERGAGGAICVMSSMVASIAYGFAAAFIPAQGAKEAMVRNLAAELGPDGIRVNGVAPGSTRTPSLLRFFERYSGGVEAGEKWAGDRHPLGRIAEPAETAEAVAFLLSDDASFVTGHTLRVEGGFCSQ
ncbi:MAG: SDR family oxidoreductase [Actinomycetota bacterium]|nr:SDR family oxidoreductase [Actinomycetota bacterium]